MFAPPASSSVDTRIATAAAVLLYAGPAAGFVVGSPLRCEPVLQLLAFFGAFLGIFSLLVPSFIALGLIEGRSEMTPADAATLREQSVPLIVIDALVRDGMRVVMVWLLVKSERFFRSAGNQVMYFSRVRMLPSAAAAGFGFGLLRGLCVVASAASAAMTVSTTTTNEGFVLTAPPSVGLLVDVDACPWMPLLVLQCATHLLNLVGDTAWAVLWLPAVIMWSADEPEREKLLAPAAPAAPPAAEAAGGADAGPIYFAGYRITTITSPALYWGLALTALCTHLVFACVSLVNTRAWDWGAAAPIAARGCEVSLSVQAVMVVIALAGVVVAVRKERYEIPAHMLAPSLLSKEKKGAAAARYSLPPRPADAAQAQNKQREDDASAALVAPAPVATPQTPTAAAVAAAAAAAAPALTSTEEEEIPL